MDITNLRINELSDAAWDTYQRYLDALDRYDIDAFSQFLADEVVVQFNNTEPMTGKQAALDGLGGFWASIRALGFTLLHAPLNIYGDDHHYVLEALNHYDSPDGRRTTVRAVAFTDRNAEGAVSSIRVYQDLSPLYAPAS